MSWAKITLRDLPSGEVEVIAEFEPTDEARKGDSRAQEMAKDVVAMVKEHEAYYKEQFEDDGD